MRSEEQGWYQGAEFMPEPEEEDITLADPQRIMHTCTVYTLRPLHLQAVRSTVAVPMRFRSADHLPLLLFLMAAGVSWLVWFQDTTRCTALPRMPEMVAHTRQEVLAGVLDPT